MIAEKILGNFFKGFLSIFFFSISSILNSNTSSFISFRMSGPTKTPSFNLAFDKKMFGTNMENIHPALVVVALQIVS
jgi:hypothetical protein